MSTTEKALKAKADAEQLVKTAIQEQLGIIKEAEKRLVELGYTQTSAPKAAKAGKKSRNTDPSKKSCPICKTTGHDGRAHRGQKKKAKFTAAELKELGL